MGAPRRAWFCAQSGIAADLATSLATYIYLLALGFVNIAILAACISLRERSEKIPFRIGPIYLFLGVAWGLNLITASDLPDVKHFPSFLRRGMNVQAFNRAGYLLATPVDANVPSSFESPVLYAAVLKVNPSDPLLKEIGIRFVAFQQEPPEAIRKGLIPISAKPIDSFWLYKLPSS